MCLGVPGEILKTYGESSLTRMAQVSFAGVLREVALCYTPEANVGDYVIVHVGFAISVIDQTAALKVLETLDQLGETQNEISN